MAAQVDVRTNLREVKERIERACERAHRDPSEILLVGVTKKKPVQLILEAIDAGLRDFGENYVQELLPKARAVREAGGEARWHFVGRLQSNKVRHLVGVVSSIHSVDRESVVRELKKRVTQDMGLDVYVEVNVGEEEQKGGASALEVEGLVRKLLEVQGIRIAGLMCIPPWSEDPETSRPYFARLRTLRDDIRQRLGLEGEVLSGLSMGMSHDFEVAIEEGATVVRVGTALFGPRE